MCYYFFMIKALIFDMDGTLLNTLADLAQSTNFALFKSGFEDCSIDEIKGFIGDGVYKLIERALNFKNLSKNEKIDEEKIKKCIDEFKAHYSKNMYNSTAPYAGIVELLEKLKKKNIKTAVVSNKFDSAIKQLCEKYFNNLIDIAIGQSDKVPPKPAPIGVFEAIKQLGVEKSEVLFVGDSDVDVKTAKNAKIKSAGVLWGYRDDKNLAGADYIIKKPDEILEILIQNM